MYRMNKWYANNTLAMIQPTTECWSQYTSVVLGVAFFISELLPFFKKHSTCRGDDIERAHDTETEPSKPTTCLQRSDGLLHAIFSAVVRSQPGCDRGRSEALSGHTPTHHADLWMS